jgi:hypothetical protein
MIKFEITRNDGSTKVLVRKAEIEKVAVAKLNQLVSEGEIKSFTIL